MKNDDVKAIFLFVVLFVGLMLYLSYITREAHSQTQEQLKSVRVMVEHLEEENEALRARRDALQANVDRLTLERREVLEKMQMWLDEWQVEVMEITGYAPGDPDAVEGTCHDGNPDVTFSGEPPIPGETAAGHIDRLGQRAYVMGRGFYRINDIGGAVGMYDLDLCFANKKEALEWGVRRLPVVIKR